MFSKSACEEVLKSYWGYPNFRLQQWEVIEHSLNGGDGLVLFPTGGGKSLCYQIPGLVLDGICIVVSPLISLMKDQTDELLSRGISAAYYNSELNLQQRIQLWKSAQKGQLKFVFISPEALGNQQILEELKLLNINLIAIDEAHCVSEWGHDFRPSYLKIHEALAELPDDIPRLALTATATPKVLEEIKLKLNLRLVQLFKSSFKRSNLAYFVIKSENTAQYVERIIRKNKSSGIIYAKSRAQCHQISSWLNQIGFSCKAYHAGLSSENRNLIQQQWKTGEVPIVAATNAFGMGINKADVRWVIHLDAPQNCEAYFQEAGRAGRDGERAFAVLFSNKQHEDWIADQKRFQLSEDNLKHFLRYFYRFQHISLHEGQDRKYTLNLKAFSDYADMNVALIKRCLTHLKNHEFLNFNTLKTNRTYFKFRNLNLDPDVFSDQQEHLFKLYAHFIRQHAGEHLSLIPIDEDWLSQYLGVLKPKLKNYLKRLEKLKLISLYEPEDYFVTLTYNREQNQNRFLGLKALNQINIHRENQAYDMQLYIQNSERCRTAWMMNYFSEQSDYNCGICDVCLKNKPDSEQEKNLKASVDQYVSSPIDFNDLLSNFRLQDQSVVKHYLQELILNKTIKLTNQFISPNN
ncbi:MAG: RecQ family ATP-dependent DNA helicase [Flavobacteriales bacterium]